MKAAYKAIAPILNNFAWVTHCTFIFNPENCFTCIVSKNNSLWTGKRAAEFQASRTCTLYWRYLTGWAFGKGTETRNGWLAIHLVRSFICELVCCWDLIKLSGRVTLVLNYPYGALGLNYIFLLHAQIMCHIVSLVFWLAIMLDEWFHTYCPLF